MWEEIELKELCDFREGYVNPSQEVAEYFGEDIKWLRANDLNNGYVKETSRKLSKMGYESAGKSAYLFEPNTLAISKSGTIGQLGILQDYMCGNRAVINIIPNTVVTDIRFIFYSLLLKQQVIKNLAMGSVQKNLYISVLGKLKILNPPLPDQQKIAGVLTTYDELIENNNRRIELLEKAAQNLYREWFVRFRFPNYMETKFENGLPQGWKIAQIKEIGKVITGKTPSTEKREFYGGDIPFIKTPDMHGNIYVTDTAEKLSRMGGDSQKNIYVPKDSICVNCIGALSGSVSITVEESQTNQQINTLVLHNLKVLEYVFFALRGLKETIILFGNTGSTMTNLSKGKFEKLKILLPDDVTLYKYNFICNPIFSQIKNLMKQNRNLIKQRDLLLPRLISGKLEI